MLDIEQIRQVIPHRYPFLLVDRILELEPGKRAVGLKNVTINESFFQGHFPVKAIMPGVLILEAMAQVGGVMVMLQPEMRHRVALLGGIENARFRRPVVPGDTLIMEVEMLWMRREVGRVKAVARVNGELAAEAEITFALPDPERFLSPPPETVLQNQNNS
ncbi:MAG: 3-hydroxyacyl-[acyl-carrier-protein] dehydratase FabZ [Armatimonadetes bacterium CP1_7O]|nr:MAG: 3-hydroxyacyl-[acyl-carrier-protein] dehydratase FabZ [Armatimonadetes bacterium CP1_7O]